jgi:hypothetical protein
VGIALLGAALLVTGLAACDSLLDVSSPSRIPASPIETPANVVLLSSGAVGDFDCALGSFIVVGGELTDELEDATATAARWVYDKRSVPTDQQLYAIADCDGEGTYVPINRARESADNLLRILTAAVDSEMPAGVKRDSLIAITSAYAGYDRVLLGEMFCSAVISTLDPDGTIEYGTELTPQQVFQSADSMFTQAITNAQAGPYDDALNMAYIGRARARLDMGQYDAAKADAQQVTDPSYIHYSTASATTTRRENRIWAESNPTGVASSVGPRYQNMTYAGVADPRVQSAFSGDTSSSGIIDRYQKKYPQASTPIPVATWVEAQLIIAEADVRGTDPDGAVDIINMLHDRAGLPHYNGAMTPDAILAQVIEERSRELWLQGQRLYDVIRNDLAIDPAPGTPYRNGGSYGPAGKQLCLRLPDVERAGNPNLH